MKRTGSIRWGKLQVGVLLMFAIAVMMWASLSGVGTSIFDTKIEFHCYFENVNGLLPGSPVWMSGMEIGSVKSVRIVNLDSTRQVMVVGRVKHDIWPMITQDSKVQLGTIGLLGDKYVAIIPGTKGLPQLIDGDLIETEPVGDASKMFLKGEQALDRAGSMVNNLDEFMARLNRGEGSLGKFARDEKFYEELTRLLTSLTTLSVELHKNQASVTNSIESMTSSVGELSDQVKSNSGTIGRLLTDPALYDNLAASSRKLDSIMYRIDRAEGSLGLLVSDTALYVEITNLAARVNNLVKDIEENPRKYFKFSVF